jgi:hypothetical protein
MLNTSSKSPQIYSTKIHDKIHSICMYQAKTKTARFEVLTAVLLKIQVFWFMTLCRWASNSGRFERPWCRHLKDQAVQDPEDEDIANTETTGTTHPTLQHNMPAGLKLRDENFYDFTASTIWHNSSTTGFPPAPKYRYNF